MKELTEMLSSHKNSKNIKLFIIIESENVLEPEIEYLSAEKGTIAVITSPKTLEHSRRNYLIKEL